MFFVAVVVTFVLAALFGVSVAFAGLQFGVAGAIVAVLLWTLIGLFADTVWHGDTLGG